MMVETVEDDALKKRNITGTLDDVATAEVFAVMLLKSELVLDEMIVIALLNDLTTTLLTVESGLVAALIVLNNAINRVKVEVTTMEEAIVFRNERVIVETVVADAVKLRSIAPILENVAVAVIADEIDLRADLIKLFDVDAVALAVLVDDLNMLVNLVASPEIA